MEPLIRSNDEWAIGGRQHAQAAERAVEANLRAALHHAFDHLDALRVLEVLADVCAARGWTDRAAIIRGAAVGAVAVGAAIETVVQAGAAGPFDYSDS